MSKIEEPLEKGWLGNVMRDVRNEVATWPVNSSYPKPDRNESCRQDGGATAGRGAERAAGHPRRGGLEGRTDARR